MAENKSSFFVLVLCILAIIGGASSTFAGDSYPVKPLKFYVGYGAGGSTDLAARAIAATIPTYLNQPTMVINKVGGSGSICFDEIIKSKPDGYKILMATIGQVVLYPARNPKLPLHWDDVNYVARTQVSPNILLVAKKSPLKNLQDLVNKLKENPGKLKYGATGLGAVTQLGPCILLKEIGLKVTDAKAVNYDSDPEGILAMVRGETDFWQGNLISAASSISSGIVRPLAVTTSERVKGFDDVPTYKELGYPGINITAWRAVAVPKTTPPEIVKTLEAAIEKTTKSKPWLKTITNMGDFPAFLNSEDTNKFVGDEFKRFRTLFTELGLLVN